MKAVNIRFQYVKENGLGNLSMLDRQAVYAQLNDLSPTSDCNITLTGTIKPAKESKTLDQLGYYHAVVVPYFTKGFRDLGNNDFTDYDSHEFLKAKWYAKEVVDYETGEIQRLPRSLAEASIEELSELINNAIIFADNYLNVTIPPPTTKAQKEE